MQLVACNVVHHRARGDFPLVCRAAPLPFFAGEVVAELHSRSPHCRELLYQGGECPRIEIRTGDVIILLKTGQRRLVVAADTECTVSKDAFGVRHMAYDFFDVHLPGAYAWPAFSSGTVRNNARVFSTCELSIVTISPSGTRPMYLPK